MPTIKPFCISEPEFGFTENRNTSFKQLKVNTIEERQHLQEDQYRAFPGAGAQAGAPEGMLEDLYGICIYEIRREQRAHTGVWALSPYEDLRNGRIKGYVRHNGAGGGVPHGTGNKNRPVLITYATERGINTLIASAKLSVPLKTWDYCGDEHRLWVVNDGQPAQDLITAFGKLGTVFIVDTPHSMEAWPYGSGSPAPFELALVAGPRDCFSALYMADDQLVSRACHQVIKPGFPVNPENFFRMISKDFEVMVSPGNKPVEPNRCHHFGLYMEGQWYQLILKQAALVGAAFSGRLDANILYTHILLPTRLLSGSEQGIRSISGQNALNVLLEELDQDRSLMAVTLHPASLNQLMSLCYVDGALPAKTTCIDPQILPGLLMSR